ncbi:MAG: glycerol kinase GlpK [Gammaproteobacteria bacterium]|nr:MAG: glycerol kinase GlpK [Gammaproteobacteria bacterium]
MDYVLAIDQGTHASRALLLDQDGQVVARSLHPVTLVRPRPGRVEQDAEQLVSSVQAAVKDVLHTLTSAQRDAVRACGITTQRSTVTAWQPDGASLCAALSWQDTRGARQLEKLHSRAAAIRKISGLPLSAHYGASKLHWLNCLADNPPEMQFGPLAGFLLQRLTQERYCAVDHSNAQRMQLFDIHTLGWSRQLADWFDVPLDRLPPCHPVLHGYGTLSDCSIPVTALCGDQNAAWFGSGQTDGAAALVNLGSGAFILAPQTHGTAPAELLSSIACSDQGHCEYLLEGTVNGAGSALQWLQAQWPDENIQSGLPHWLEQVTDPPLFMNTVGGLGSPWWCQGPAPEFVSDHDRVEVAEAAVAVAESILFLIQYNLAIIQRQQTVARLRVSGGLSRLGTLCQKLANLSKLPVQRADDPEASARGIAWLAANRPENWQATNEMQHFEPRSDTALENRYTRFIEHLRTHVETRADE